MKPWKKRMIIKVKAGLAKNQIPPQCELRTTSQVAAWLRPILSGAEHPLLARLQAKTAPPSDDNDTKMACAARDDS